MGQHEIHNSNNQKLLGVTIDNKLTFNERVTSLCKKATQKLHALSRISTFTELLEKDNSVTVHERNLQTLAVELFKVVNGLSPEIMNEIFPIKENIGHCSRFPFKTNNIRTVYYGTETISFLGPKIWSILPNEIKESESLIEFKNKIKKWKPKECPCRLCKTYISGVGFITVAA